MVRVKRQSEQPALFPRQDSIRDVEERFFLKDALHDNSNRSGLFDDKKLPRPIACVGQIERRLKTSGNHRHEFDLRPRYTTARLSRSHGPTEQKS
jgi:hypothetical protein